ncbi:MAG: acetate--CoA ligase [Firmicutes bacterium]|nr:acetate--CoA ligase [Bacillota bacterium]
MPFRDSKVRREKEKANLADYEQAYNTFQWADAEREMALAPDGRWNIAAEAVDRQAGSRSKNKPAFLFYDGRAEKSLTYLQLKLLTNRFANVLRNLGVRQRERVAIYLPVLPEFYISFLGVIKAGAVAIPLSAAFMSDAVTEMLRDSEAVALVTTGRLLDRIKLGQLPAVRRIILVDDNLPAGGAGGTEPAREIVSYSRAMAGASESFDPALMERPDHMLLLYTSGSTGKPKGVIHVHGGIPHYFQTGKWVLDLHEQDIYWCTADPGWVTGISYGIWAPLLNGVTSIIYHGSFNTEKWYEVLARYRVNVWYTTPTALRRLMNFGPANPAQRYNLRELRHILTVGEPLNPMVIRWSGEAFGIKVYDTWWMTETGGVLIGNFRCLPIKPGSMGRPIPGIYASIVDEQGRELPPLEVGQLAIRAGWPAMMGGIWKDEEKYREYFRLPPWYLTGDLAYRDPDGFFWFQGRVDDVIKKAGERIGPFEVENKLIEHPAVLEAGVIGKPDALWGEIIKAFIVLRPGYQWSAALQKELQAFIESRLGSHLAPHEMEVCQTLPRTCSGKLLRRVLKAMEMGLPSGDLSTMKD